MIRLRDAGRVATAKLRSHKLSLIIVMLTTGLLFGVAIALSIATTGLSDSLANYRRGRLTSRYIVEVSPSPTNDLSNMDYIKLPNVENKIIQRYQELVKLKIAKAKELGVSYNKDLDSKPYLEDENGTITIILSSAITQAVIAERWQDIPVLDQAKLSKLASQYGAIKEYTAIDYNLAGASGNGALRLMRNGQEKFYDNADQTEKSLEVQDDQILDTASLLNLPVDLVKEFMLPDNAGWLASDGTIPVVLQEDAVEQLLGLSKLSSSATAEQKTQRLHEVRSKTMNLVIPLCYRNKASLDLIQQTISQTKEIAQNKNKSDYSLPEVIYKLPDPNSCSNPSIVTDRRASSERDQDRRRRLFDEQFNNQLAPVSYQVKFKVVGISPSKSDNTKTLTSLGSVIDNLTEVGWTRSVVIPDNLYNSLSAEMKQQYADLFTAYRYYFTGNSDNTTHYLEFANSTDMNKFIQEQGCQVDRYGDCTPTGRPYQLDQVFSNSSAIDDIEAKAEQYLDYVIMIVAVISVVVMGLAMNHVIADSRHETAVFRAIGFKQLDLSIIYLLYAFMLSVLSVAMAGLIGWGIAAILNTSFSYSLTVQARYSFADLAGSNKISLLGVNYYQLSLIVGAIVLTGLTSALLSVLVMRRRDVVEDLKRE